MVGVDDCSICNLYKGLDALFGKFVCDVVTFNTSVSPDLEDMHGVGV